MRVKQILKLIKNRNDRNHQINSRYFNFGRKVIRDFIIDENILYKE